MGLGKELDIVRNKIIDAAIWGTMILVFPTLVSSVLRYFDIGWKNIFLVHILSTFMVSALFIFRKKLSLEIKVHLFSILFLIQSFAGLLSFRIVGVSCMFLVAATIPTLIFGRKQGVLYSLAYLLGFIIIGLLQTKGVIYSTVNYNEYSNHVITWISFWFASVFALFIIVYSIGLFYNAFTDLLKNLMDRTLELTRFNDKIKFQEERFNHFMDAFPYPITIKDKSLRYIYGNKAAHNLTNIKLNDFIGQLQMDIYPKELSDNINETDQEVLASNQLVRRMLHGEQNDKTHYYELIKFPLHDADGQKLIGSITIDRTEQMLAEQKLIESKQTFMALFTKAADGVSLIDDGHFINCNQAVVDQLGYSAFDDIIGKTPWDLSPEFQSNGVASKVLAAQMIELSLKNGYHSFDWVHLKKNGAEVYYSIMLTPITINTKKLIYCVWRNVTEKHKAQEALIESEKKYRSIFEGSIDGFLFIDQELRIIECNQSLCNLLKYEKQELLKMSVNDITQQKWFEMNAHHFREKQFRKHGNTGVFEIKLSDRENQAISVEINIHELTLPNEQYYWAVIRDISERKRLEEENFSIMVSSEEKERARYAKELHDGLGPILSTSMIYLHTMRGESNENKLKEHLDRTYGLIEEAVVSIREISNNLSPEILTRYGLVQAIRSFIEKLKHVSNIEFNIRTNLNKRLLDTLEFTLYRTIIELINNSIKHAKATTILIVIEKKNDLIEVKFEDNGQGFDYEQMKENSNGFGLINLEKRILKIGGDYSYQSKKGNGVHVGIQIKSGLT